MRSLSDFLFSLGRKYADIMGLRGAQYAAAKTNLSTGPWTAPDSNVNDIIGASATALRNRARQLVRDMPAMATAVRRLEEFTVGDGVRYKPRVLDPGVPILNKKLNQQISDAWNFWMDEADDGGRMHFYEIQQLCCRMESEIGEYLIVFKESRDRRRYLPFALSVLEPDQLSRHGTPRPGNEIFEGVEYNRYSGRPAAYHVVTGAGGGWTTPTRIPAFDVILGYKTIRPGQLRGVTELAPAILLAHSFRDFVEAEVEAAQKAARWLAFVTTPNPQDAMDAFGIATSADDETPDGHAKYVMEMGNAVVDFLQTGESVTIAEHSRPSNSFSPFAQWALKTFAATAGVTYELLSGDYSDAAYTGARVARNDMLVGVDVRRGRLVRQCYERVRQEFLRWAVLTSKVRIPDYFTNPAPYQRGAWQGPGMAYMDPLREGRAHSDAVGEMLESPQEVLLARGRDPEQMLDDLTEWEEMLADRGLSRPAPAASASMQTNPAAVAPGTGSLDGEGDDDDRYDKLLRRVK